MMSHGWCGRHAGAGTARSHVHDHRPDLRRNRTADELLSVSEMPGPEVAVKRARRSDAADDDADRGQFVLASRCVVSPCRSDRAAASCNGCRRLASDEGRDRIPAQTVALHRRAERGARLAFDEMRSADLSAF